MRHATDTCLVPNVHAAQVSDARIRHSRFAYLPRA
jgi:hypothetical protein